MSRLETPFRYDHVGSFLRPEKLKEARRKFDDGDIGYDELKKVEDEAITELVGRFAYTCIKVIFIFHCRNTAYK